MTIIIAVMLIAGLVGLWILMNDEPTEPSLEDDFDRRAQRLYELTDAYYTLRTEIDREPSVTAVYEMANRNKEQRNA